LPPPVAPAAAVGADEFYASAAAAADEVGEEGMIARPNNIDLADAIWEINNRNRVSENDEALGMDDMNVLRLCSVEEPKVKKKPILIQIVWAR